MSNYEVVEFKFKFSNNNKKKLNKYINILFKLHFCKKVLCSYLFTI